MTSEAFKNVDVTRSKVRLTRIWLHFSSGNSFLKNVTNRKHGFNFFKLTSVAVGKAIWELEGLNDETAAKYLAKFANCVVKFPEENLPSFRFFFRENYYGQQNQGPIDSRNPRYDYEYLNLNLSPIPTTKVIKVLEVGFALKVKVDVLNKHSTINPLPIAGTYNVKIIKLITFNSINCKFSKTKFLFAI